MHLFGYFKEDCLAQMASDASIGIVDDVFSHITDALTAVKENQFKEKFTEEDE